jgi:hypothetical protein
LIGGSVLIFLKTSCSFIVTQSCTLKMSYHGANNPLVMEPMVELICATTGKAATLAAFDSCIAGHFTNPYEALQSLFAWGTARSHVKLLQKLQNLRSNLPFVIRVAVDPAIGSPSVVWKILLPDALAHRDALAGEQFIFDSVIALIVSGCMDTVRFLCSRSWAAAALSAAS